MRANTVYAADIKELNEFPDDFDHDELLEEVDHQFVGTIYLLVA